MLSLQSTRCWLRDLPRLRQSTLSTEFFELYLPNNNIITTSSLHHLISLLATSKSSILSLSYQRLSP
ncbi:hypothetical protein BDV97DRAFT_347923 [Delphinella strobiligena]|nr:hypothetical protein BDV97DRAFT_347923 [Delphinella strobiligena]